MACFLRGKGWINLYAAAECNVPHSTRDPHRYSSLVNKFIGDIARCRNFSQLHRRLSLPNPSGGPRSPIIVSIHVTWSFVLLASASAGWASLRLLLEPQLLQCQRFISAPPATIDHFIDKYHL